MLTITKKADYGLLFLHALAQTPPATFVPLKKITQDLDLPYKFLSQIASQLSTHGLVESKEGLGGGYRLQKAAHQISVHDILHILEGPTAPVSCLRGKPCSQAATCPHQRIMKNLASTVDATLSTYTLADLAD